MPLSVDSLGALKSFTISYFPKTAKEEEEQQQTASESRTVSDLNGDEPKGMKKIHRKNSLSLLFLILHLQSSIFLISLSNASNSNTTNNEHLFQDVLKELAASQNWDLQEMRILNLDTENVRFGFSESYEIRFGFGKTELLAKFDDGVSSWRKPSHVEAGFGSLIDEIASMAALRSFKILGPFDLMIEGAAQLSLSLPMNATYGGLKRILVGEGITVEVSEAKKVSVFYSSDPGRLLNQTRISKRKTKFYPFWLSFCLPLLPIHISGSAIITAYRTRNPEHYISTTFLSKNTVELLSDKCYGRYAYIKNPPLVDSLKLQFNTLEGVLRRYLSNWILQNGFLAFIKVTMKASVVVRFQLEIESNFGTNSSHHATLAEWRTKPTAERAWFEVLAVVAAMRLKPLVVKKLKPSIVTDSTEWRNLLPNISFTKFPSLLIPPEALTLDIRW